MTTTRKRWLLVGLLCLVLGPALAAEVPVHECDRLAADPEDSNKVGPGVHWNLLDPERTLPACEGWNRAFEKMAAAGDDALLVPESMAHEWDEAEWEW